VSWLVGWLVGWLVENFRKSKIEQLDTVAALPKAELTAIQVALAEHRMLLDVVYICF